ncbi:mitochondrial carrier domain-containing protein [Podospora appendiculata]|uniref:Mitochondrial carrier domain-containing protein n=1 Tax=Podospora appendiculata TaxID=314037 RepID=A0AAE0XCC2_9PEZI|nr:mitochondrial carrier domain-containing protein [Podospora appendiculata]
MSADFWAGYISGAVGIIIGNPLDVLKVRLQAGSSPALFATTPTTTSAPTPTSPLLPTPTPSSHSHSPSPSTPLLTTARSYIRPFLTGTAAPVLGYGALNALLFISYNRTEAALNNALSASAPHATGANLWTTWLAGAVGGLATWVVSTPTELVKCRAQLASSPTPTPTPSSWQITKQIVRAEGLRGLYFGGAVTALRDSVGYGFYFWSYELSSRWFTSPGNGGGDGFGGLLFGSDAARVLLCGGLAGIVTWASIFPLDVIKTRVQTQAAFAGGESGGGGGRRWGLGAEGSLVVGQGKRLGAWDVAKETYREGGARVFFRGLAVCSLRAFVVNAVQWTAYEWIMAELGQGRKRGTALPEQVGLSAA